MDNNKIKRKMFKIKPSHFVSLGYFIFMLACAIEMYNEEGIPEALMAIGLGLLIYGIGFAMVRDMTK